MDLLSFCYGFDLLFRKTYLCKAIGTGTARRTVQKVSQANFCLPVPLFSCVYGYAASNWSAWNYYTKYLAVFGGNNNISKADKMVDAYGAVTWWGFSPALDINDKSKYYVSFLNCSQKIYAFQWGYGQGEYASEVFQNWPIYYSKNLGPNATLLQA